MMGKASGGIDQAEELENQLNQALKDLDQIRNTRQTITDPDGLEAVERAILQATDKIAALMTALKIQQAVDSDELREKADERVQAMPEKLKNQGRRLVSIQTSRGAAVKVAAPYFSRKKSKGLENKVCGCRKPMVIKHCHGQGNYHFDIRARQRSFILIAVALSIIIRGAWNARYRNPDIQYPEPTHRPPWAEQVTEYRSVRIAVLPLRRLTTFAMVGDNTPTEQRKRQADFGEPASAIFRC